MGAAKQSGRSNRKRAATGVAAGCVISSEAFAEQAECKEACVEAVGLEDGVGELVIAHLAYEQGRFVVSCFQRLPDGGRADDGGDGGDIGIDGEAPVGVEQIEYRQVPIDGRGGNIGQEALRQAVDGLDDGFAAGPQAFFADDDGLACGTLEVH